MKMRLKEKIQSMPDFGISEDAICECGKTFVQFIRKGEASPARCPSCLEGPVLLKTVTPPTFDEVVENLWRREVPEDYRACSPEDLPKAQWSSCFDWALNLKSHGLLLMGDSESATRLAAATLLERMRAERKRSIMFVRETTLAKNLKMKFGKFSGEILTKLERVEKTDILLLDKVGFANATPSVQESLYELIEERLSRRKTTTILTTQYDGEMLAKRFADQRMGIEFVRRLRTSCQVIPLCSEDEEDSR